MLLSPSYNNEEVGDDITSYKQSCETQIACNCVNMVTPY